MGQPSQRRPWNRALETDHLVVKIALGGHADRTGQDLRRLRGDAHAVRRQRVAQPGEVPAAVPMLLPSPSQAVSVESGSALTRSGRNRQVVKRLRRSADDGIGGAQRSHRLGNVVDTDDMGARLHRQDRERKARLEAMRLIVLTDEHAGGGLSRWTDEHGMTHPRQLAEPAYQFEVVSRGSWRSRSRGR